MADVFISYSTFDREFARMLRQELQRFRVRGFMDHADIGMGAAWDESLRKSIADAQTFVIILSPAALSSNWVMAELGMAESLGKQIIPVVARGAIAAESVPAFVADHLVLDANTVAVREVAAQILAVSKGVSLDEARAQLGRSTRRKKILLLALVILTVLISVLLFTW